MILRLRPDARRSRRLPALLDSAVPALVFLYALILGTAPALAQSINLDFGDGGSATGRIVQLVVLLTVITLAPSILVMVTSFVRSEEHTSELQSLMRISYAVFCLKKKKQKNKQSL